MDEQVRHERLAVNESAFRQINDRLQSDLKGAGIAPGRIRFVCECSRIDCREQIELTPGEYEAVRADPMRFAIVPGHEFPDAEDVVERGEGFYVVRKHDDVADIVRETDPRS